jgi:pimeloyl-ACP methyl ester carboxylesterase
MSAQPIRPIRRPKKSTNVRSQVLSFFERRWPDATAAALEPILFRTMRRPVPEHEREVLRRGKRLGVSTPHGMIPAWSFGEGPAVVLVHGWNGRGAQLGAFVDPLVCSGHHVVMFDAPGHGDARGRTASLLDFADATDAVVDAVRPMFGPVRAILAHSMGGAAVTYATHRRLREPITRLERGLQTHRAACERFVFIAPPIDVRDFVRGFVRFMGGGLELERSIRRRIEDRFGVSLEDLYAPSLAREIDAPLLIVHDENDKEVPLDRGRLLAEAWPGSELAVTSGLGHMRILRDEAVIRRIVRFIA